MGEIVRLQKYIAMSGAASRRAAETMISEGRVAVNGKTVTEQGVKVEIGCDSVTLDKKTLEIKDKKYYIMLNKPVGYVSTVNDQFDRPTVVDLVRPEISTRIFPVGRLDYETEGMLLMTNDGDFANYMMHPSHNVDKTYLTRVEGEDIGVAMEYLREPMELDGYVVDGAEVDLRSLFPGGAELEITIHEGRNRQVRKMCEAVGLKVLRLKRISEGALELGELKPGAWRYLTPEELERVRPKGER